MRTGYQQGDVILELVNALPEGAVKIEPAARGVVIAEGEVTGHAHVMSPERTEQYGFGGDRYVVVSEADPITHEEHAARTIAPGTYKVGGVVEKDWLEDAVRPVVD